MWRKKRDQQNRKLFTGFQDMPIFSREIGIQHPLVGPLSHFLALKQASEVTVQYDVFS